MLLSSLRRVRAHGNHRTPSLDIRGGSRSSSRSSDNRRPGDGSDALRQKMDATISRIERLNEQQQQHASSSGSSSSSGLGHESRGPAMAEQLRSLRSGNNSTLGGEGSSSSNSGGGSSSKGSGSWKRPHWSTLLVTFLAFDAAAYVYYNDVLYDEWQATMDAMKRSCRLVICVGQMLVDYHRTTRSFETSSAAKAQAQGQQGFAQLTDVLLQHQHQQQLQHKELFAARAKGDTAAVDAIAVKIDHTRKRIEETSELIAAFIEQRNTHLSALHARNARLLKHVCELNRGIYIKLGQHLSMLDHIIPVEYQEELRGLLASNPTTPYSDVERVFEREFGKKPLELFDSFDPTPIASASLAQVHVAYKGGVKYAVKVQHPGLREAAPADVYIVSHLVDTLSRVVPGFDYSFLSKQLRTNLPKELDFVLESYNIARCRLDLSALIASGDVAVPSVYKPASGHRVLTMSFEEGDYISDAAALRARGLQSADVARIIAEVFCHQIFEAGFVHSDPHEANLLVRAHPTRPGRPQLVLLDHGLYQELPPPFRKQYCRLWFSLCMGDEAGIKSNCQAMGAGPFYTLFSAMLTMKPWEDIMSKDISRLKSRGTTGENVILTSYVHKYLRDIVRLLGALPSELLLVLKANDCIRHIDRKLGVPVNSAIITMRRTGWAILREDFETLRQQLREAAPRELLAALHEAASLGQRLLRFLLRLGALEIVSYWLYLKQLYARQLYRAVPSEIRA